MAQFLANLPVVPVEYEDLDLVESPTHGGMQKTWSERSACKLDYCFQQGDQIDDDDADGCSTMCPCSTWRSDVTETDVLHLSPFADATCGEVRCPIASPCAVWSDDVIETHDLQPFSRCEDSEETELTIDSAQEITWCTAELQGVVELELLQYAGCLDAVTFCSCCQSFRSRLTKEFWKNRFTSLPPHLVEEEMHPLLPNYFDVPSPLPEQSRDVLRHIARLEARAMLDRQEREETDYKLCAAAHRGCSVWPLLFRGGSPSAKVAGRTALAHAAAQGHDVVVQELISASADIEAVDRAKDRPLVLAVVGRHVKVARTLLEASADPEVTDGHGDTPLVSAVVSGYVEMVEVLLDGGADVEAPDADGDTPLLCAVVNGLDNCVRALLRREADVEALDMCEGETPLLRAVNGDHPEVVRALLEGGASLDATDAEGRNALEIAEDNAFENIIEILLSSGN